jgi:ApeA N-terminal domain 1
VIYGAAVASVNIVNLDLEGYFWLPTRLEDKTAGRLTFDQSGSGTLRLLGSLPLRGKDGRVIGQCHDGYYTLESCFVRNDTITSSLVTQEILVGYALGGVAYDPDEEPLFDRIEFRSAGLTEWVQPPPIAEDLRWTNPDGTEGPLKLELMPFAAQSIVLPSGELKLAQSRGFTGDGLRERTLTQSMSLNWKLSHEATLADVVALASDVQDLISIGTDRVAAYDYIHLYHKDLTHNGHPHAVRLIIPWLARPATDKPRLYPHDMAFTFDDIGGMTGIRRWLDAAHTYQSMLGHVMNTYYVDMLTDVKLAFRAAALHGLHRTWKGYERNLKDALVQLADLAGDPFTKLTGDPQAWCDKAKDERNNLAHHYQRLIHQTSSDLYYSAEVSYWLFVLCMMRLADLPNAAFDRVSQCPQFEWLRQQLNPV